MNRQQIVIRIERMNRFSKQLTYWVELGSEFYLPAFDPELSQFGQWAKELQSYLRTEHPDSLVQRILSFPKQDLLLEYLEEHQRELPKEIYASLSAYASTINAIKELLNELKAENKGDFRYLVDGLAFKEAADLLQRCVDAGILTEEYQPMPTTTSAQLRLIAFAVSTILKFKVRNRWAFFEEQWNHSHNKLSGVSLPIRNAEVMEVVINLFPEVDFSSLFAPKVYLKFDTPYNTAHIKRLYTDLMRGMYLDESTSFEQFLGIFGKGDNRTPVNWIQEQRKLGYFIHQAFAPTNKDFWKKAVSRFRVNGELPHKGSLQSGYQALVRDNLVEGYCPELMENVLQVVRTAKGNHARGRYNQREIDVIKQEVMPEYADSESVGIITPYRDQANEVNKALGEDIASTVHKYQGRECDTIIMSTVDNEPTDFSDDVNLLNVAISRAKTHLCIVTNGNEMPQESNLAQLIAYMQYNNFEVKESKLHSVFDLLYKQYTVERLAYEAAHPVVSEHLSENLVYDLLVKAIAELSMTNTDVLCHYPLSRLIEDWNLLTDEERAFAESPFSHADFLIYNSLTKQPLQTIEVDGWQFHKNSEVQQHRDALKDQLLTKFGLCPHRISTTDTVNVETLKSILQKSL